MKKIRLSTISLIFIQLLYTPFMYSNTPEETISAALTALMTGNIETLLEWTEKNELIKTRELLKSMENPEQKRAILEKHQNLKSWSIIDQTEQTVGDRQLVVITVQWEMIPSTVSDLQVVKSTDSKELRMRYIHYMLEEFNGTWKIISRKTLPTSL